MKIYLTKPAIKDLDEAEAYIKKDNSSAATRMIERVFEAIEYLMKFPDIGRIGRLSNTRELIISGTPFLVVYQIRGQRIIVLRVLHAARKWPL